MDIRPSVASCELSSDVCGVIFTSNVPVACLVTTVSFCGADCVWACAGKLNAKRRQMATRKMALMRGWVRMVAPRCSVNLAGDAAEVYSRRQGGKLPA